MRFKKAREKMLQIRNMCRHPVFQKVGWLKSIKTFFQASVASTLLYAAETWYYVSDKFGDLIEAKYRYLLVTMLGVPKTTKYLSLLHELDIMQAKHIIAMRMIKYLNQLLNGDGNKITRNVVVEEYNNADDDEVGNTFIGRVRQMCEDYMIPDITCHNHFPEDMISEAVKEMNSRECWRAAMTGRLTAPRPEMKNRETMYMEWPRAESMAILKYRTGLLKFRAQLKYLASNGDMTCRYEGCDDDDTYLHATKCPWVRAEKPANNTPREMARFLVELNRERMSMFKAPIL